MVFFVNRCLFRPAAAGTADFVVASAVTGYQTPQQTGQVVNGATYHYASESDDLSQWEGGIGTYSTVGPTLARTQVLFNSLGTGTEQGGPGTRINFNAAPRVMITALAEDFGTPKATANLTFYVSSTGSDSNPGTLAQPFATVQHAINVGAAYDYQNTYSLTIHVEDGTYVGGNGQVIASALVNGTSASIIGNNSTPSNVRIVNTQSFGNPVQVNLSFSTSWVVSGVEADLNGLGGVCFSSQNLSQLTVSNVNVTGLTFGNAYPFSAFNESFLTTDYGSTVNILSSAMNFVFAASELSTIQANSGQINLPSPFTCLTVVDIFAYSTFNNNDVTWNAGTVSGAPLWAGVYSQFQSDANFQITDLPGNISLAMLDVTSSASPYVNALGRNVSGFFPAIQAGLPAVIDLPNDTWSVFKDTSGGGVYLAYNDAGTIKKVALT